MDLSPGEDIFIKKNCIGAPTRSLEGRAAVTGTSRGRPGSQHVGGPWKVDAGPRRFCRTACPEPRGFCRTARPGRRSSCGTVSSRGCRGSCRMAPSGARSSCDTVSSRGRGNRKIPARSKVRAGIPSIGCGGEGFSAEENALQAFPRGGDSANREGAKGFPCGGYSAGGKTVTRSRAAPIGTSVIGSTCSSRTSHGSGSTPVRPYS